MIGTRSDAGKRQGQQKNGNVAKIWNQHYFLMPQE
jgi:hypothetical protein